jgi:hypothetical protein
MKKKKKLGQCFFCLRPPMQNHALQVQLSERLTRNYAICKPCAKRPGEYLRAACMAHEGCELLMADNRNNKKLSAEDRQKILDAIEKNLNIVMAHGGDTLFLPPEYKVIIANQRTK